MINTAIRFGGDTDSVASFAGALAGAANAAAFDSAEAQALMRRLADIPWRGATIDALASGGRPPVWAQGLRPVRNLTQLGIVLGHGLWRLTGR